MDIKIQITDFRNDYIHGSNYYSKCYMNGIHVGNFKTIMKENPEWDSWHTEIYSKLSKEDRNNYPQESVPVKQILSHYSLIMDNHSPDAKSTFKTLDELFFHFLMTKFLDFTNEKIKVEYDFEYNP